MTWSDSRCGKTVHGRAEHCPACHETFTSTQAGDAHRTGPMENRRCLTPDEMRNRPKRPLEQDQKGSWRFQRTPDTRWAVYGRESAALSA